jgi:hypothetical protein
MLGLRRARRRRAATRVILVGHAFLYEGAARFALQVLVIAPNLQVAILSWDVTA